MDILEKFKRLAKEEKKRGLVKRLQELPFVDPKHVFPIEPIRLIFKKPEIDTKKDYSECNFSLPHYIMN